MNELARVGSLSDRMIMETWCAICDLIRCDVYFTTSEAARKLMESDKLSYGAAYNRCDITLRSLLGTTPDLQRDGRRWMLPSLEG